MKNKDLKPIYDSQKLNFHSGFNESMMIVNMLDSWQGLDVLEIGCGHGHLASILSYAGADYEGCDYSEQQVIRASENYPKLHFFNDDMNGYIMSDIQRFDVVVMQGVLEHLDEPWQDLDKIMENLLRPGGTCCLSVPHWVNPRGYIFHALRLLFDAKMSLTDLHYFLPGDFKRYCEAQEGQRSLVTRYECQFFTCDESWAGGDEMIADFRERLPKALGNYWVNPRYDLYHTPEGVEFKVTDNIDKFLKFLEKMLPDISPGDGACLGVKISK